MSEPRCEFRNGCECGFPAVVYDHKYRMTVCHRHAFERTIHEGTEGQFTLTQFETKSQPYDHTKHTH